VAVPLDPRLTLAELEQSLGALHLDALLLLHGSTSPGRSAAEHERIPVIELSSCGDGELKLKLSVPVSGSLPSSDEPDPNAPAFILQTSGTTARPKIIPFSHRNMLAAAARLQVWFDLTYRDRCLSASPPYYSHGLKVTVFTPLLTGGSIAVPANSLVVDFSEWFDILRPTWYSAGPTLHRSILDVARGIENAAEMHTLRFIVSGGAPLPKQVREDLQATLDVPVLEHYGSSEAAQIATNLPPPGLNKPGTCGVPWPGTVMIAGENGRPLPPGEQGEVWVRGPTVMSGYLDAPDLNRAAFVDGWLRTGDVGSLDSDGFLTLHGRLKELINRGGEKIAPLEVDCALLSHPSVAEAATFGIPHPRLGEDVAAAVVLNPGAVATPAELRKYLSDQLASFKVPRRILILDRLPKGTTGKIQRRHLTESFGGASEEILQSASIPIPGPLDLEAELLSLWRRLLKSEAITIDDDFFDKGGDSLLAMEMLTEIDWLVEPQVSGAILFEAPTIRQLVPRLTEQACLPAEPLVHLHPEGSRPPLLFFHGDFVTGGIYVRRLASLLGPDQPIIAIAPHGLTGEPVPQSIEEMAADRVPLILERLPQGPFWLGGLCNGALVAFEVARLLLAAGHKVEAVMMIDPPTTSARPAMRLVLSIMARLVSPRRLAWIYERIIERCERASRMPPAQLLTRVATKVANKVRAALGRPCAPTPRSLHLDAYSIAMARYSPAPLSVPVVFFAADHDGRAWRRLTSEVEVIDLPGGHLGCVTTNAAPLVEHLRQRIAAVDLQAEQAQKACG